MVIPALLILIALIVAFFLVAGATQHVLLIIAAVIVAIWLVFSVALPSLRSRR